MNRKNNCIACRYQKDGVKTRKALVHTCGKYSPNQLPDVDSSKEYFLSTDLYDDKLGNLGAICVWSRTNSGGFELVHCSTVIPKEFEKEVQRIADWYNTKVIYETKS